MFVDTWGWMALGHRRDPQHAEVRRTYEALRRHGIPIWTSDYVLDELITLLFRREVFAEAVRFVAGIMAAQAVGHARIERVTPERFFEAWELRKRFHDKPTLSFTDLTSMVIMGERGIHQVLTGDEHFVQVGMGFLRIP